MTTFVKDGLFARYCVQNKQATRRGFSNQLFTPNNKGALSVQLIDDLERNQIIDIGKQVVRDRGKQCLYGWGVLTFSAFEQIGLEVLVDDDPRPGHTNIKGWPKEREITIQKRNELADMVNKNNPVCLPCCAVS